MNRSLSFLVLVVDQLPGVLELCLASSHPSSRPRAFDYGELGQMATGDLKTLKNPGKRKHEDPKPVVPRWGGIFLTHFAKMVL